MYVVPIEKDLPHVQARVFGATVVPMVPETMSFDVCGGCVDGLIPMLGDLRSKQVTRLVALRQDARARSQQFEEPADS